MSKENFIPDELTGQGNSSYSSSMPDGGSPDIGPAAGGTPSEDVTPRPADAASPSHEAIANESIQRLINIFNDPDANIDVKRVVARQMAEAGLLPKMTREEPEFPQIDPTVFTNDTFKQIAGQLVGLDTDINRDPYFTSSVREKIAQVIAAQPEAAAEAALLESKLKEIDEYSTFYNRKKIEGAERTFSLTLVDDDFARLQKDPMEWLRDRIDKIYQYSAEGQELGSTQIRATEQQQEVASRYLKELNMPAEKIKAFDEEFRIKIDIMYLRATIQQRKIENVQGQAQRLQTHGLLTSLAFEEGMVNRMHNRIQEIYDDERIKSESHHIRPEDHSRIQKRVIDEYVGLVKLDDQLMEQVTQGKPLSPQRREELIRDAITRSVRTGYDHFVASQREAIIVARG